MNKFSLATNGKKNDYVCDLPQDELSFRETAQICALQ